MTRRDLEYVEIFVSSCCQVLQCCEGEILLGPRRSCVNLVLFWENVIYHGYWTFYVAVPCIKILNVTLYIPLGAELFIYMFMNRLLADMLGILSCFFFPVII
jgi:hypothetical protein